jgi:DNA repair exonuclease SbcCD ATPase subunit
MSDLVTWGVKVTEEQKDKMRELLTGSGMDGKDFVEYLSTLYESKMSKEKQPLLKQDIEEVETITRRLLNIFINVNERLSITMKDKDGQYQTKLDQQQGILNMLHDKIREQEVELLGLRESNEQFKKIADDVNDYKVNAENNFVTQVNRLTELLDSNKALMEEYRAKNENLTELVNEYKGYKEKNKDLIREVENEQSLHVKSREALKDCDVKVIKLEGWINEMTVKHSDELKTLKDKLSIEHEKELLKKDREYQNMIQSIRDEYNQKVKELLDGRESIRRTEEKADKGSKKKHTT